jgi:hypothetical protein
MTVEDNKQLVCQSIYMGDEHVVEIGYGDFTSDFSVNEARSKAAAIIRVAAIAETEAAIARKITEIGKHKTNFARQRYFHQSLILVRDARPVLPLGIEPIYGSKTQRPLVVLYGYKPDNEPLTLEIEEALEHAEAILVVAEAVQTDAWLAQAVTGAGVSKELLD